MQKLFLTYSEKTRDGYISVLPETLSGIEAESVEEIQGEDVLEKLPDLIKFIEECYRILIKGGKITLSSPYYASAQAWGSPLNIRGVSERTLNFASKDWRDANKWTDRFVKADFEVAGSFAVEESVTHRAPEVQQFWTNRYLNVAQAVFLVLTKKVSDVVAKDG
jgi:hypothetical protein